MELPGVVVHSLYKPPPEPFQLAALGQRNKPHIVIGGFDSHSTLWGYTTTNSDGESVEQWADSNSVSLIHSAQLPKSFNSAIWKKGYTPDLIFASSSNISDMCGKCVMYPIPRIQHHPMCVTVNPVIVPQPTTSRIRFNLKKANWDGFSTEFDEAIEEVNSIPDNYGRFIELLRVVSRRHIPRGRRSNYIPGLTEEFKSLYEAYKRQYSSNPFGEGTLETETTLIYTMKEQKRNKWEEVITSTDMTVARHGRLLGAIQRPNLYKSSVSDQRKPSLTSASRQWRRNNANPGPRAHKWLLTEIKIPKLWRQSKEQERTTLANLDPDFVGNARPSPNLDPDIVDSSAPTRAESVRMLASTSAPTAARHHTMLSISSIAQLIQRP